MPDSNHNTRIELALADLASQLKPNYSATARKHSVERTTLAKRHRGQTLSIQGASSEYRQRLTYAQEEALIKQINRLTDRSIPPTSQMVRNLAEELAGSSVGKNWTSDFVRRHRDRLKSLYLRNMDQLRTKSEYAPLFKQFYDLVEYICYF
jgi:hypothetical protein